MDMESTASNNPSQDRDRVRFMRRALHLALRGAGRIAPNPMVGAVIFKDRQIIGEGFHRRFGGLHAEIEAINDCKSKGYEPSGASLAVTLEPCCHYGKTPPCTKAIIEAGIKEVVIATLDETEKVSGKGIKELSDHGVIVSVGCLGSQAHRLNAGFFKLNKTAMPLVILKWAQSINGKLNWPKASQHRWITSAESRRHVHQLRKQCGAILVGIDTVLADDPLLTVRLKGNSPQPIRIVLDGRLRIPPDSKLIKTAHDIPVLIFTSKQTLEDKRVNEKLSRIRSAGAEVMAVEWRENRLELERVLKELGRRGVCDLLVEGGAKVHQAFIENNLADRLMIYIAPVFIPDASDVVSVGDIEHSDRCRIFRTKVMGDDVLIEADVVG